MTAVVVSALWVGGGLLLALFVGRVIGMAPDPDAPDVGDHDLWGCDDCERQAVEQAMQRHPSARARELAELEAWWEAS